MLIVFREYVSYILDLLVALSPLIIFIILLVVFNVIGGKQSKEHWTKVRTTIQKAMQNHAKKMEVVQLKPEVYEIRCKPSQNGIGVETLNYSMVNRTFFVNVIINKIAKEKERFFIGVKFRQQGRDIDPAYKFFLVPYVKKRLISSRFEEFVKYDDIPTPVDPRIEKNFMIKSGSEMEIEHFTKDPKILGLIWSLRKNIELISLDIAKEDTDPHLQATFDIFPNDLSAIQKAIDLFFLIANAHLSENEAIRKKLAARKSRGAAIKTKSAKKKKKKQK